MIGLEEISWQNEMKKYPKLVADFKLIPEKTALIIVDMQYYDAHADYGLGKIIGEKHKDLAEYFFIRLQLVLKNCVKLVNAFRKRNLKIFYVTFGASMQDGSDMLPLRKIRDAEIEKHTGTKSVFTKGTFEHNILDELKPLPEELVLNKTTRCAFAGTNLDHIMRMVGIESTVIIGALTNVCVENTARSSADKGYKTFLVEDATATFSHEMQSVTLLNFALFFGKVSNTDEIIKSLFI